MRAISETVTDSTLVKKVTAFHGKQNFIAVTQEKKTVGDPAGHSPNLHTLLIPFNILF